MKELSFDKKAINASLQIQEIRKNQLIALSELIIEQLDKNGFADINFICTHNSRRSQLAEYCLSHFLNNFGVKNIYTYSGGTEATALNERIIQSLKRANIDINSFGDVTNPRHQIAGLDKIFYSKKYDDPFNPKDGFIAVMVCNDADENCPVVSGATKRFSLQYIDPKLSDDSPDETDVYDAKLIEIASEMYLLSKLVLKNVLPLACDNSPVAVELKEGVKYSWCSCGLSSIQPFCDGQHRGTSYTPIKFVAEESKTVYFCNCKQTKNACFCDGSHNSL